MATKMWQGASLTSADLRIYEDSRFASVQDDSDDLSDTSSDYSHPNSDVDDVSIPEPTCQSNTSLKPRKRVTFRTEETLIEIFEIPARGDGPEFEAHADEIIHEVVRPKEFIHQDRESKSELIISGQAASVIPNKKVADEGNERQGDAERPRKDGQESHRVPVRQYRSEKSSINRASSSSDSKTNTDTWGTYTVTHAIAPGPTPPCVVPAKSKFPPPAQRKPKVVAQSHYASSDSTTTAHPVAQKSTPPPRRNVRAKSAGKTRKKVSKVTKDTKTFSSVKSPGSDNISEGDQKLIAMFLEKNVKNGTDTDKEPLPAKAPKPKNSKTKGSKRISISAKNKEKEMINKEMKGESQKRIYRTPYNNISSLHKNGARLLFKRLNSTDLSDNRYSTVKSSSKYSASKDSGGISSGPKVKMAHSVRGRPTENSNGHLNGDKNKVNSQKESSDKNNSKNNINDTNTSIQVNKAENKSGFIFPEENKFHFPLMSQPKETTSQLVRLDINMLAVYKKKLYAWHMANGTPAEGRVETPCISPMYESSKNSYS